MNKKSDKKYRPVLILELLHTFSEKELEDLSAVVGCRYFNTDKYVVTLLKSLTTHVLTQAKDESIQFDDAMRCAVYKDVFSEKKRAKDALNPGEYNFLKAKMNTLARITEQYLCNEVMKTDKAFKTKALYQKLLDKRQNYLLNRHITRDQKLLEEMQARGVDYYDFQFEVESGVLHKLFRDEEIGTGDNLPEVNESLDLYYLLNKLKLHLTAVSFMSSLATKQYDFSSIEALSDLLKLQPYAEHPLVQVYQTAIELLKKNHDSVYEQFSRQLFTHAEAIPREDLKGLYVVATIFCAKQIKMGQPMYKQLFELHHAMDIQNLLSEGNFIELRKLKNVLGVARRVGESEWALKILKKYTPMLKKAFRESVYHFHCGLIAFDKKNYNKAISHLAKVDKINDVYDINGRIMFLKAHYETDTEYDERTVRILLQSEKFIKNRKNLIVNDKKAYKNFIRILINIYNTRYGVGKMTKEKIKRKLEKFEFVSDKKWLEEKISELE